MAYQVYLTDGVNSEQLDTGEIDFKSIFSVADITDITTRKNNVKTINFKGTKNNNRVLGSLFDLGRTTDLSIPTDIFFNYNPLIGVTAFVYENDDLIFKGSLRVKNTSTNNGNIIYNTYINGSYIDLKVILQDKYLTDIDFTDLKHRYNLANITNSWNTSIERFSTTTSTFSNQPFTYGNGYVYPNVDYGYSYKSTTTATVNQLNVKNFKPAIFVKEYFDRIFSQPGLTGFSYEIKASDEFKTMFNHLIVPDCQEGAQKQYTGLQYIYAKPAPLIVTESGRVTSIRSHFKLMPINNITVPTGAVTDLLTQYGTFTDVLSVSRNFTASGKLDVSIEVTNMQVDGFGVPITTANIHVQLVKRGAINNNNPTSKWVTLSESVFPATYGTTVFKSVETEIGITDFKEDEQIGVRIAVVMDSISQIAPTLVTYKVSWVSLNIPKDTTGILTVDIQPSLINGDTITPIAPVSIKQTDFLKSIITQFNFYVYSPNDNYKHIIFEKYDDYYANCSLQYLNSTALDWSNKMDYKNNFDVNSNIELPKAYNFLYKTDVDYLTDLYTKKFNVVYGSFNFNDSFGLVDAKKVELIFSPLILTTELGTDRKYPLLYKVESNVKKTAKTNIRLAYYNGLQPCTEFTINNEEKQPDNTLAFVKYFTGTSYPQVSNYYLINGVVKNDIHFGSAYEVYFTADSSYINAATSYQNYYQNQISELTNINVKYVSCSALLNESDIGNLDLKIPVYISTGKYSNAYFKVLEIDYSGKDSVSAIKLQLITF